MKITLKQDWDLSVTPPNRESPKLGYFAGRKNEISQLTNELVRRSSGAILISGHRGVGKTSMAYKALQDVLKKDKNLIVVLMNASQLEVDEESKEKINPKRIIENLIRRLYSVANSDGVELDKELKEKIETLYKKAIAKEVELRELLQNSSSKEREEEQEQIFQVQFDKINNQTIVYLITWVIAVSYQLSGFEIFGGGFFDKLIPLLMAFPIPYTLNYLTRNKRVLRILTKRSQEVAELYKIDNAIGNLEFDLEDIHSKLASKNKKLVYVIDELDKLDVKQVKDVLKYFKNLFTLSEAIFIFIGGEELISLGRTEALGNREKEYTYFTSRYYLSRPRWEDLSNYISSIASHIELDNAHLEIFKRAVCFDSANDFFDIKSQISDRVTQFNNKDLPFIEFVATESELIKSRLHKAITMLYEERYMSPNPLKWKENEELLRKLFSRAYEIQKSYFGFLIQDPGGPDSFDQAIRDFHKLLMRLEVLKIQNEILETINSVKVPVCKYTVSKLLPNDPPERLADYMEYESRFMKIFEYYCDFILLYANILKDGNENEKVDLKKLLENPDKVMSLMNGLGVNFFEIFDTQKKIYQAILNKGYPYPYQIEIVEENSQIVDRYVKNIILDQTRIILPRLIQKITPMGKLGISSFVNNSQTFSGVASSLRAKLMEAGVRVESLHLPDYSRQMLFLDNGIEVLKNYSDILRELIQTHRVVFLSSGLKNKTEIVGLNFVISPEVESFEKTLSEFIEEGKSFFSS